MMATTRKLAEVLHATNPAHAGCERRYDEHGPGGGAYYERWADAILASGVAGDSVTAPLLATHDAMLRVLTEHRRFRTTAGWNGSPDPQNWRNIAAACICGERVADATGFDPETTRAAAEAHRAHVAAALAAALTEDPTIRTSRKETP